jgi:hypothetical protein
MLFDKEKPNPSGNGNNHSNRNAYSSTQLTTGKPSNPSPSQWHQ